MIDLKMVIVIDLIIHGETTIKHKWKKDGKRKEEEIEEKKTIV